MTPVALFAISGVAIAVLAVSKTWELNRQKRFFVLSLISKGDIHIRKIYHRMVRFYSEGKEFMTFFFKKQIPMHSRNVLNKTLTFIKERRAQYANNVRNSRLLKKSDGISEFYKNIAVTEKENEEINDAFHNTRQNDSVGLGSQNTEDKVK